MNKGESRSRVRGDSVVPAAGAEIRGDGIRLHPLIQLKIRRRSADPARMLHRADADGKRAEKNPTEDCARNGKPPNTPHATSHALCALFPIAPDRTPTPQSLVQRLRRSANSVYPSIRL